MKEEQLFEVCEQPNSCGKGTGYLVIVQIELP